MEPNLCGGDGHGAGGPGGPRPRAPASGRAFALPQVGTSSSAEEVCSSVDGFFFPRPMILVIFFPVTLDTVPLPSDLELFFLLTVKNNDNNKKACFNYRLLTGKSITIKRCRGQFSVPPVFPFEPPLHASYRHVGERRGDIPSPRLPTAVTQPGAGPVGTVEASTGTGMRTSAPCPHARGCVGGKLPNAPRSHCTGLLNAGVTPDKEMSLRVVPRGSDRVGSGLSPRSVRRPTCQSCVRPALSPHGWRSVWATTARTKGLERKLSCKLVKSEQRDGQNVPKRPASFDHTRSTTPGKNSA